MNYFNKELKMDIANIRKLAGLTEDATTFSSVQPLDEHTQSYIRKYAGLTEAFDDDDDDDELKKYEKDLKKIDADLKKKGVSTKADPDKDLANLAKKRSGQAAKEEADEKEEEAAEKAAKAAKKQEEEKESAERKKAAESSDEDDDADDKKTSKSEEKAKDEKPAEKKTAETNEPKRRGQKPNPDGRAGKARAFIAAHPGDRKAYMAWAMGDHGWSYARASAFWQSVKGPSKKSSEEVKECYVLRHPSASNHYLVESNIYRQYQWSPEVEDGMSMVVFESAEDARTFASGMATFSTFAGVIEHMNFED
jgi:outer membrane biosynthesis protein TonB